VALEPSEERRVASSCETLLIDPVVIGTHIRIDEGSDGVKFGALGIGSE